MTLPPAARRLFPGYPADALDLADPASAPFVVGRLLEDGDRADLAWLFAMLPEAEVAAWLAGRGDRQLSRRSRAFWKLVFGAKGDNGAGEARTADADALWPL